MRIPGTVWIGLAFGAALVSAWALAQLVGLQFSWMSDRAPTEALAHPVSTAPTRDLTGGRYWNDPSVDPALLERAFAPAPRVLPPEAQPKASAIVPPQKALQELQAQGAVAY
jgi:hypothetical protein